MQSGAKLVLQIAVIMLTCLWLKTAT